MTDHFNRTMYEQSIAQIKNISHLSCTIFFFFTFLRENQLISNLSDWLVMHLRQTPDKRIMLHRWIKYFMQSIWANPYCAYKFILVKFIQVFPWTQKSMPPAFILVLIIILWLELCLASLQTQYFDYHQSLETKKEMLDAHKDITFSKF